MPKFVRREIISQAIYDPTAVISWTRQGKRFRVELMEMFDVTCRVYWKGKQILFTSPKIHLWLNKIATAKYNRLENAFQTAMYEKGIE